MSHPIGSENRAHHHAKDRVAHLTGKSAGGPKCYARGGGVHGDEAEDKALLKKSVKASCMRADGGAVQARADKAVRRAKGGHVKHKGSGKTNVNVIVAPSGGKPPMAGVGMPPVGAAPPMPPKPPPVPMPAQVPPGGPSGLGGMPPPPIRSDGGRAFKRGGGVKEKMSGEKHHGKHEKPYKMRAAGGPVSLADKKGTTGIGDRTPIQHSGNKSDSQNIGRGPVITRATGGPIYSDAHMTGSSAKHKMKGKDPLFSEHGPKGPDMPSGSSSGPGRRFLAHQYSPKGHEPWNKDYKT